MAWLLHVHWWNILHVFPVLWFLKMFFFLLFDSKDYRVLCNMGYRKGASFLLFFRISLFFKILLPPIISLRFLFFLCAIIGLSWKVFLRVGLICNKCQCLSMVSLMFGRVLLNFSSNGILFFFFFLFFLFLVLKLIKLPLLLLIFYWTD